MFVRFRRLPNGGDRPIAAREDAIKWQWVEISGKRRRRYRRWVIGRGNGGQWLEPYRLKVTLIENTRINGKVKQEIVAVLGSIDATWLESFWKKDPALRCEDWEYHSLKSRTDFWQGALDRMNQIGDNRLSKDDRVAIRRTIHKVIPWVMEPERKRLELLEAQRLFKECQMVHSWTQRDIERDEKAANEIAERLPGLRLKSAEQAEMVFRAGIEIAKLK
jgi:hypothetical protein